MQSYDIPLHDIKPLLEVQEYSLYYLIGTVTLFIFLLIALVYIFYKWFQNRNKFDIRKEHSKLLKNVKFTDSKKSAYEITFYGNTFKDDSLRHTEMYKNVVDRLEVYKYKKDVNSFDKDTKAYIELYMEMIDV